MKSIISQTAERDIYNISGDLIVNTEKFTIHQNLIMPGVSEQDKTNQIESRIIATDYNRALNDLFKDKITIQREKILENVENVLQDNSQLVIVGDPGIGKTCLLNELNQTHDSIYISIKDKPAISVYKYLLSKLLIIKNYTVNLPQSETEIFNRLEYELQEGTYFFLIDDAEKNESIAQKLMSLEKFNNKFVFASRTKAVTGYYALPIINMPNFDENEIAEYLTISGIDYSKLNLIELSEASRGNPLYLYYFAKFQITPYPKGLEAYQESLWWGLKPEQKSLLSLLALAPFPLEIDVLTWGLNKAVQERFNPISVLSELERVIY